MPSSGAIKRLYELYLKIGATSELPSESKIRAGFLADFWVTLYLRNHRVPGDIPFDILIEEFTTAMVQGVVQRKGNNQASICQAMNDWISRPDEVARLYRIRDQRYPHTKPKQVTQDAKIERVEGRPDNVFDWTAKEVRRVYDQYRSLPLDWQQMVAKGGDAAKLERTKNYLQEQGEWK